MFLRSILLVVGATATVDAFAGSSAFGGAFTGRSDKLSLSSPSARLSASSAPRGERTGLTSLSMAEQRRVVVTGMGITSCLGNTLEDVTESLKEGKSGIGFREDFAKYGIRSQICGSPNLTDADYKELIPRQTLRFMGGNAKYAYIAMDRAIQDSGLKPEEYNNNPRVASIIGQGGTSLQDVVETADAVRDQKPRWANKVGPYRVTRSMGSTTSAVLSTAFKLQGPSFTISSACSTGAHCIGVGMEQIVLDKADMAVCGAGELECFEFTSMFDCMGALSTKYNDTPEKASRAFDKNRDGFVIAGGGGIVILEELEHAKARGAKIYAELTGYAANADGYDVVAPSGVGGENCMKLAMAMADKSKYGDRKIDYVNTHGTSTPVGDIQELGAIKRTFEPLGYQPKVGSTKSLSGHSLGAAGVHEAIYSLLMMDNDFLAASANIEDLVEEAEGMEILTKKHEGKVNRVISNSFGFGGTNACLCFDRFDE
uniref:Nodulation protein E n=1 Tax=Hemiselmis andersenii TaxID=464988 RepID=A0A6U4NBN5_HEMAN|mmetsp:Transcript_34165/g.80125  ORF Transcript_34165/g.80125 Transcript_34165/m.80125 type:complete len:485 (-) Transcript_34165:171-1625(-)